MISDEILEDLASRHNTRVPGYMLTVGELRRELANVPDTAVVVLALDPDGTRFSTVLFHGVEASWFVPRSNDVYDVVGNEDFQYMPDPEDLLAISLWPRD